jgi:hypothetical protein
VRGRGVSDPYSSDGVRLYKRGIEERRGYTWELVAAPSEEYKNPARSGGAMGLKIFTV